MAGLFLSAAGRMPRRIRNLVHRKILGFMEIDVRLVGPAEVAAVSDPNAEFNGVRIAPEDMARSLASGTEIVAVAYVGPDPVGFGCARASRSCCYEGPDGDVRELYVREAHRRKGVATRILALLERELGKRGADEACLVTGRRNWVARRAYETLGYRRTDWVGYRKELPS